MEVGTTANEEGAAEAGEDDTLRYVNATHAPHAAGCSDQTFIPISSDKTSDITSLEVSTTR